jgi:hypothetical protein
LGYWPRFQADYRQACEYVEASVTIARDVDDSVLLAHTLAILGPNLALVSTSDRAAAVLDDSLLHSRKLDDAGGAATALRHLGIVAPWQAQYERADGLLRESVAEALVRTNACALNPAYPWDNAYRTPELCAPTSGSGRSARRGRLPPAMRLLWQG